MTAMRLLLPDANDVGLNLWRSLSLDAAFSAEVRILHVGIPTRANLWSLLVIHGNGS